MDNCSVYIRGILLSWSLLLRAKIENIWPPVYIKKWQKDFQVEEKKRKLMELTGSKRNILGIFSQDFLWDQQRQRARTHLHHSWRATQIQHLFTINYWRFFFHNWLLLNPFRKMAAIQLQLSVCKWEKQNWHSPRVGAACMESSSWGLEDGVFPFSQNKTKADSGKMERVVWKKGSFFALR